MKKYQGSPLRTPGYVNLGDILHNYSTEFSNLIWENYL